MVAGLEWLVDINPANIYLAVVRDPLLNGVPSNDQLAQLGPSYLAATVLTLVACVAGRRGCELAAQEGDLPPVTGPACREVRSPTSFPPPPRAVPAIPPPPFLPIRTTLSRLPSKHHLRIFLMAKIELTDLSITFSLPCTSRSG